MTHIPSQGDMSPLAYYAICVIILVVGGGGVASVICAAIAFFMGGVAHANLKKKQMKNREDEE